jgi:hypothetical protein
MKFEIRIAFGRSEAQDGAVPTPPRKPAGDKIGRHVRETMAKLASQGKLSREVVRQLRDPHYCKRTFNLRYPFLRMIDPGCRLSISAQSKDRKGHGRYWVGPFELCEQHFLMCNDWYDRQRDAFDRWARELA